MRLYKTNYTCDVCRRPFFRRLANKGALSRRGNSINPTHYTRYGLLQARNEFRQNPPANLDRGQCGSVEGDFASGLANNSTSPVHFLCKKIIDLL